MGVYNNKRMVFFFYVSCIVFTIIAISNLLLPLCNGAWLHPDFFQIGLILVWLYGMLCSLGYFKREVYSDNKDTVQYEIYVPIVPIGFLRVGQALFYVLTKKNIDLTVLCILIVLDLLYIVLILMDKSNYYYECKKS